MDDRRALVAFLGISDAQTSAFVVALLTALGATLLATPIREWIRFYVESRLHRRKAHTDYEYEQIKRLRDTIGAYHGRVLEAATRFNYRLVNLGKNHQRPWLTMNGDFWSPPGTQYYLRTTVHRFSVLVGTANRFEREALFIDGRIAEDRDLAFLLYIKALRWTLTDAALFDGLNYDDAEPTDHFLTDTLRETCAAVLEEGDDPGLAKIEALILGGNSLKSILEFFDGIRPGSLRWDRLMVHQLMLMSFINRFGYDMQRSEPAFFEKVALRIEHDAVANNFASWLPRLGLNEDPEVAHLRAALRARLAPAV